MNRFTIPVLHLTKYIAQKYGEDKLRDVTKALGNFGTFSIDAAFDKVLGKDGNEIYDEWSSFLKNDYRKRSEKVLANLSYRRTDRKSWIWKFLSNLF